MAISSEWAGPPVEWAGLPVSPTLPYLHVSKLCFMRPGQVWVEEPAHNIDSYFLFSSFFLVCVSVSATVFSEVLPPFFPPPTFSSVKVGGVVVVVGSCGGTDSGI